MTTNYTVQAGDTLTKIAKATGMSVSEIAKQNNIKDVNCIMVGQTLKLGQTNEDKSVTSDPTVGLDLFEREEKSPSTAQTYAPLAYGLAGAALYQGGKAVLPKLKDTAETAQLRYMYAKEGVKETGKKMTEISKQNAKSLRDFIANKAKHAAKSAELHYAFGKDAVQKGIENAKDGVKKTASNVAQKAKHAAKSAELHYAFGKDAVQKGVENAKDGVKKTA